MERAPHHGTPPGWRSKGYIIPSRKRPLLLWSTMAAVAIVSVMIGAHFAGARRAVSPGTVASHHARVDLKCAQCHEPGGGVAAVRCERCHDPSGSERLAHAAHVWLGTTDVRQAASTEPPACVACHQEHRGLSASPRAVDDRECARCHTFSSLAAHPEFAVVRAQATGSGGLKFNHDRHVLEAETARGASCQTCHEQTPDRAGFVPLSFDRHCASCHLKQGAFDETDPVLAEALVAPADLPPMWSSRTGARLAVRGRKVVASGLRHQDGWVLFNALRLRQAIDGEGEAAERLLLRGQIARLEQLQTMQPMHRAAPDELNVAATVLEGEIRDLRARLSSAVSPELALNEALNSIRSVSQQLAKFDPAAAEIVAGPRPSEAQTPPAQLQDQARFDERKAELLNILATVAARAGEGPLRQRADDLRAQVERLTAPSGAETSNEKTAIAARLTDLADVVRSLRAIQDPGARTQVAQIDALTNYGRQRVLEGLSPEDFQTRKTELLELLDAVEQRGGPAVRMRVAPLRQRVLALSPGTTGIDDLTRSLRQREKQLERVRLEIELLASPDYETPPAQGAGIDQAMVARTLQQLRRRLTELETTPRLSVAHTPEAREQHRNELDALLSRCLKCHEYDPGGVRLSAVRAAEPMMSRSGFDHAPHTAGTTCETCHGSARTSKLAHDVNVPGVATCRTCHNSTEVKADCQTCHVYHPASPATLLAVTR
jgi:hypothetical protein